MAAPISVRARARALFLGLVAACGVVACTEDLESGAACPVLCPAQNVVVYDTTFEAVSLDTSLTGIPGFGTEASLFLASRGDTLDVRAVVRYDTLPASFFKSGDSAITRLDSAYVLFAVNPTGTRVRGRVRLDLYDVDTLEADTVAAVVRGLFRPDRLIGGTTFDSAQVKDSIKVFLDKDKLLAKVTAKARLRVGVRLVAASGGEVELGSSEGGTTPLLRFDPAPEDTAIKAFTISPASATPPNNAVASGDFLDYSLVFAAPSAPTGAVLSVGGLPNRRAFLRFALPSRILDSSIVLRASLLLTQRPLRALDARDTLAIVPELTIATDEVTDLTRATLLSSGFAFDTLRAAPGDSGVRVLEVATAVRSWVLQAEQAAAQAAAQATRGTTAGQAATIAQQQAIILRTTREGASAFELQFFSREAVAALRPRLRLNYALRTSFGIP